LSRTPQRPALTNDTVPVSPNLAFPTYDRSALTPAVVHFGVGGFHRAHQAAYLDELAESGVTDWGVIGVGIQRPELGEVLSAQDNLFIVVQRGTEDSTARVIGSMVEYLLLAEDPAAVRARLVDPRIRLVTMTITGDGYAVDDGPEQRRDSLFAVLVDALDARRRAGVAPFTVLSCDNLPDSGAAARRAVLGVARRFGSGLAEWIERHVTFPSSMVDRITPSTAPADRDEIADEFQVVDRWPVVTEPFRQWVIEDSFCNDRPPLDRVGVRFVADVAPYKLVKSRLLNGTHSALGYLGSLAGYRRTDEAMGDPVLAAFVEHLMCDEIAPLLPADVPDMELAEYPARLLDRFRNPAIGDDLSRLCGRGSTKMPGYLLPTLHEARRDGRPRQLLTLAVAAWLRYLRGTDLAGCPVEVKDARADELRALAAAGGGDPRPLLALADIFGDLAGDEDFAAEVELLMKTLDARGVQDTVVTLLHGG
jgi:mannitol 2-dehydrogenase